MRTCLCGGVATWRRKRKTECGECGRGARFCGSLTRNKSSVRRPGSAFMETRWPLIPARITVEEQVVQSRSWLNHQAQKLYPPAQASNTFLKESQNEPIPKNSTSQLPSHQNASERIPNMRYSQNSTRQPPRHSNFKNDPKKCTHPEGIFLTTSWSCWKQLGNNFWARQLGK